MSGSEGPVRESPDASNDDALADTDGIRQVADRVGHWLTRARELAQAGDPARLMSLLHVPGNFRTTIGKLVDPGTGIIPIRSAATIADPIVLTSDSIEVIVDIVPGTDGSCDLRGQVTGTNDVCAVQLLQDFIEVGLTTTDQWGEFLISSVPVGVYDFYVTAATDELVASLRVGEAPDST